MDAADRIVEEFDRLASLGRGGVATRPMPERIVYYVVATRCAIDIGGFATVYEQELNPAELALLVDGLNQIGETELAGEFRRGFELLKQDGYHANMNRSKVSSSVEAEIEAIGERVGERLWALDEKLVVLLDSSGGRGNKGRN